MYSHGLNIRDDYRNAFEEALSSGRLSYDPAADNYVGHYMYMYTSDEGVDMFKHRDTRQYLRGTK